jgi:hypothetical protein
VLVEAVNIVSKQRKLASRGAAPKPAHAGASGGMPVEQIVEPRPRPKPQSQSRPKSAPRRK